MNLAYSFAVDKTQRRKMLTCMYLLFQKQPQNPITSVS